MIISLDCEATGLDIVHGAKPFLITTCADDGKIRFWEWDVDPLTRIPQVPLEEWGDIQEIEEIIDAAELIYMQNSKFDIRMLRTIGIEIPWSKVRDTLAMGHLLASNRPHNLTQMCIDYLGVNIEKYELAVKEVTKTCRAIAKRDYPNWKLAEEGAEGMPSVKGSSKRDEDKPWKNDMWLPRTLYKAQEMYGEPSWLTVCKDYANADSEHTLYLGIEMERLIRERGLWNIYEHRLHLPRVACEMEEYGTTVIGEYTQNTIEEYTRYVAEANSELVDIAFGYGHNLELAEGASLNDNMREFFYGSIRQSCTVCKYGKCVKHWNGEEADLGGVCPKCVARKRNPGNYKLRTTQSKNLGLPVVSGKKTGNATLDKDAMNEYLVMLDEGPALDFIRILSDKRKHDTDLTYMEAYRRFWVAIPGTLGYYRIHSSLNPFGTDHLRWASSNVNLQNVGKQEEEWRVSVRNCFGPAPDREWWSMDFQNIELRIPAYESGEEAMIELFEKPNEPPYFGSYHCLNASIVYPDLFWPLAEKEGAFKKQYKSTEYQYCKNGGFALQYGCGEHKADNTFRRKGAYRKLREKLPKVTALNQYHIAIAERTGWVQTLPDRTVDPERGYPILASRTEEGRVLSTTPFNYHISGTACWCKNTALIRCSTQLAEWRSEGFDAHMALEIHDEIIFDFPRGKTPQENLPRALILKELMEQSGENLVPRIPTPVSISYHGTTWAREDVI